MKTQAPVTKRAPHVALVRDDRGAIMVIGLFFTLFLVGACWFTFGIGNAIDYRENLQNAADAGAFAGAVYDARGMNLLSMLNIVMGIALAILVVAHVLQLIVFTAMAATCDSCIPDIYCGFGWADCPGACSTMDSTNNIVADVDTGVHDVLKLTHYLEIGVAVGWPWVAAGKSTTAGAYYTYPNTQGYSHQNTGLPFTTSFSYSQIPWSLDTTVSSLTDNLVNFGGSSSSDPGTGTRYGLPVSSDVYSNLCTVAFMDVASLGGFVGGSFPGKAAGLMDKAGEWFCDAGADPHWVTTVLEVASSVALPCLVYGAGSPVPSLPMSGSDINDDDSSYSPMMLFSKAKMGLDYFGVWSTAIGAFKDPFTREIQIAGLPAAHFNQQGVSVITAAPSDALVALTRAEFYYDPRPDEVSQGTNAQTYETTIDTGDTFPIHNVMWNMRWRARLRRYHYFPGLLGQADAVARLMNANFSNVATGAVTALLGGQSVGDFLSSLVGGTSVDSQSNTPTADIYH